MCSGMWLTIPNFFTLVRILMTPFILVELAKREYMIGGWMFGAAALRTYWMAPWRAVSAGCPQSDNISTPSRTRFF